MPGSVKLILQFPDSMKPLLQVCIAEATAVWLNEILRGSRDEPLVIEDKVEDYADIFSQLQKKWSFTSPTLLRQLVENMGNGSLSKRMKDYSAEYDEICRSFTKLNEHVSLEDYDSSNPPSATMGNGSLSKRMKDYSAEYDEICRSFTKLNEHVSLEDYDSSKPCLVLIFESGTTFDNVQIFLDEVFGIYRRYLRVHKIMPGSVKLILQFPDSMKPLLQVCIDKKRGVAKHCNIKTMSIQATPTAPDSDKS